MLNHIKYVYTFSAENAEGEASMKNLLGGKGANLAEMSRMGVPVPPGFTITTKACTDYYDQGKALIIEALKEQVSKGVATIENSMGASFGAADNPLLLSVRSGARVSMPGMMDTVLNLGLNDEAVEGLAKKMNNPRMAWDSYRRFVQMYGDVVMDMKPASKEDQDPFEQIIEAIKEEKGVELDTQLNVADLQELVSRFKAKILAQTGQPFPEDPIEQLWNAILAVFDSWMNQRAIQYRAINGIPADWGTAVNVQAMVFGNMGETSATGVAFTRDPATGEDAFVGEYLINAQGEDVVAGIRTPQQITLPGSRRWAQLANVSEEIRAEQFPSLEEYMPEMFQELDAIQQRLEDHYDDMQDLEFTIQDGRLWILQTRTGKRTGAAMVKIAIDMLDQGRIGEQTALHRIDPNKLDEVLHDVFDPEAIGQAREIGHGLPASPGAATGRLVFFAEEAAEWAARGEKVILARIETSPEDIQGMFAARGILTTRGGMTSHAAVVARGMGKCCVSGAGAIHIDYKARTLKAGELTLQEGDWLSINGATGQVYAGEVATRSPELSGDFGRLMDLADQYAQLTVRANADTPQDAQTALDFGAKGIGLCRTEHMFFQEDRIMAIRQMILAEDQAGRERALAKLLPMQRKDFEGIFGVMHGSDRPTTVRLLDPPLHEFLPKETDKRREMATALGVSYQQVHDKIEKLSESNPMLGLRGCRLGNLYPEITVMQTRAIVEAALSLQSKGIQVKPEIMVPLVGIDEEFKRQRQTIRETAEAVFAEWGQRVELKIGTMIEVPRAALIADQIAKYADFFSFGTNDLTQLTY
ncbi:MAG: pyruvate, phosphate dikinase, partial [Bacteroidota bacterium]